MKKNPPAGERPADLLRDLMLGDFSRQEEASEFRRSINARRRTERPAAPKVASPRTHDNAFEVRPLKDPNTMTRRERIKFRTMLSLADAPIWVLISAIARSGNKEDAIKAAQAQFEEEARTNQKKAACLHWSNALKVRTVELLESGDFERPEEVAFRLLAINQAKGWYNINDLEFDFARAKLTPRPAEHAIAVIQSDGATLGEVAPALAQARKAAPPKVEEALPPMADEVVKAQEPRSRKAAKPKAKAVRKDEPKPEPVAAPVAPQPEPTPEPEVIREEPKAATVQPEPVAAPVVPKGPTEAEVLARAQQLAEEKSQGVKSWNDLSEQMQKFYVRQAKAELTKNVATPAAPKPAPGQKSRKGSVTLDELKARLAE